MSKSYELVGRYSVNPDTAGEPEAIRPIVLWSGDHYPDSTNVLEACMTAQDYPTERQRVEYCDDGNLFLVPESVQLFNELSVRRRRQIAGFKFTRIVEVMPLIPEEH